MSTLYSLFEAGGIMMWPILAASILALTVALERLWALRRSTVIPERTVSQVVRLVDEGKIDEARAICRHDGGPFAEIALAGLDWWHQGVEAVKEAVGDAGRRVAPRLLRGLNVIGTVASIAPLMGLLGTVLGMIEVFRTLSLTGPGSGEGLSAGISVALLTTAFGLSVGIPALVVYNYLSGRVERLVLDIEAACHELFRRAAAGGHDRRAETAAPHELRRANTGASS